MRAKADNLKVDHDFDLVNADVGNQFTWGPMANASPYSPDAKEHECQCLNASIRSFKMHHLQCENWAATGTLITTTN